MAANDALFAYDCNQQTPFTGLLDCVTHLGSPTCIYVGKRNLTILAADSKTKEELLAKIKTLVLAQSLVPIKVAGVEANNTDETAVNKSGSNYLGMGAEGLPDLTFTMLDNGKEYQDEISKFNLQSNLSCFVEFSSGALLVGRNVAGDIKGLGLNKLYAPTVKMETDGTNKYSIRAIFNDTQAFGRSSFPIYFDSKISQEIGGLLKVTLTATTGSLTFKLTAKTAMYQNDIYALYGTELAETDCWELRNSAGATATFTIAPFETEDESGWNITPTSGAGTYSIKMADAATLVAKNVGSVDAGTFVSDTVSVVVTAGT